MDPLNEADTSDSSLPPSFVGAGAVGVGALPTGLATVPPAGDVALMGMGFARARLQDVLDHIFTSLNFATGGWLVTVNLDILRRHALDPAARALYAAADLRIADGMPLVWASRLQDRDALPERVAGSTLAVQIAARAAAEGRSIYLLGGAPGAAEGAGQQLLARHPDLKIAGAWSPMVSSPATPDEVAELIERIGPTVPDILLVGLGSPKQEYLIRELRERMPRTWMIGVGITFSFISGEVKRAPLWMQNMGLEWTHRMVQEPGRLMRRYLVEDLPFAFRLFSSALNSRWSR